VLFQREVSRREQGPFKRIQAYSPTRLAFWTGSGYGLHDINDIIIINIISIIIT